MSCGLLEADQQEQGTGISERPRMQGSILTGINEHMCKMCLSVQLMCTGRPGQAELCANAQAENHKCARTCN